MFFLVRIQNEMFTNVEMHYHFTFKKILAIKYGIKKFEFLLIGYHFLVENGHVFLQSNDKV